MENRKLGIIFILAVALAFFAGFQVQTFFVDNEPEPFVDVYTEITEALDRYYLYDLEDDEKEAAFLAQMQGIVSSYAVANNDPYTRIFANPVGLAPTDAESYVGIGISIQNEIDFLRVLDVVYQGPSFGKLYPNDLIVGLVENNENLYFEDVESGINITSYLAGTKDEVKSLIVVHPNGVEETIDITYDEILTPTAYHTIISDSVGYIRISEFSGYIEGVTEGTAKVFTDALNALESDTLKDETDTLILDLRDNPGGALSALHNNNEGGVIPGILQLLLQRNVERPVFSMINKNDVSTNYLGGLAAPKPYDIKVLVNGYSASAAEVLAAALNINGGYELYGEPTYGKDVYQNTVSLTTINSMTYYLTYTEGYWLYDQGKKISEYPLNVEVILQEGYHGIEDMLFEQTLEIDEVHDSLISYQQFLNIYFELDVNNQIREDGYFDQATEDYLYQFQQENSLTLSKALDFETSSRIYDLLKQYQNEATYDDQLQALLGMI